MSGRRKSPEKAIASSIEGNWAFGNAVARGNVVQEFEISTEEIMDELTRLGGREDMQSVMRFYQLKEILATRQRFGA